MFKLDSQRHLDNIENIKEQNSHQGLRQHQSRPESIESRRHSERTHRLSTPHEAFGIRVGTYKTHRFHSKFCIRGELGLLCSYVCEPFSSARTDTPVSSTSLFCNGYTDSFLATIWCNLRSGCTEDMVHWYYPSSLTELDDSSCSPSIVLSSRVSISFR